MLWLFWRCVEKEKEQLGSNVGGREVLGKIDIWYKQDH